MSDGSLLLIILASGVVSQWLAWRMNLPAIVVLIAVGLILGPVTGFLSLRIPQKELSSLIGMGVALILFKGGSELKIHEFKRVKHGIGRLTILGPPLAWLFGSLAGHYIGGLSWQVSLVTGAILVVTGPTVILPLLRQAKLNKDSTSLLKWEGIVNDPIGVLLAVLTFQYLSLAGVGALETLISLGEAVLAAILLGGLSAKLVAFSYRHGLVPEHLKVPVLIVLVLAVYWASNLVQHEAGLLSVTVMGVIVGNSKLTERESMLHFEDDLGLLIISVLFIAITSQIELEQLALLNWHSALFVFAILFLVRPLTIFLATMGAPMKKEDKLLLSWIAPRGIVAMATAGIFGPALLKTGYADAALLLPLVFMIICSTVILHGLSIGPLSRKLGLAPQSGQGNGLLIVGASPWSCAFALALKNLNLDVLIVDGAYNRLKQARMANINNYYGELLSEHAEEVLEVHHLSYILAASENDYYNALVCKSQGRIFGQHRTLQLATYQEAQLEGKRLSLQQRGYFAFGPDADYFTLNQRLNDGWIIQSTKLSQDYTYERFQERFEKDEKAWLLLGGISPKGDLKLNYNRIPLIPEAGWTIIYFAPADIQNGDGLKPADKD